LSRLKVPFTIVLAGCLIPDMPWILQRLAVASGLISPSARSSAYFIAQASFLFCVVGSLAIGAIHRLWLPAAAIASFGCAIHLLLDSLQDKWGNGVNFFAPFDWSLQSFGVLGVETALVATASLVGVIPFLATRRIKDDAGALDFTGTRLGVFIAAIAVYLVAPTLLVSDVIEANVRNLRTLSSPDGRAGKALELDREEVSITADASYISTHAGETLTVASAPYPLTEGQYSVRGRFISDDAVSLEQIRRESEYRDVASVVGLVMMGGWIAGVLWVRIRTGPIGHP